MAAAEGIGPYLEQVLDNPDVQDNLRRAVARAEQAYARARGRKDAKQAVTDQGVRQRAAQSAIAARDAVRAIRRGPEIQRRRQAAARRRRRRNRLLAVAAVGGGAFAAFKLSAPEEDKEAAHV
jgi:hypothetical protein